jgi:hypothetical protein
MLSALVTMCQERAVVHPGSRDWCSALQAAGISLNAPKSDVTTAVHALGLDGCTVGQATRAETWSQILITPPYSKSVAAGQS